MKKKKSIKVVFSVIAAICLVIILGYFAVNQLLKAHNNMIYSRVKVDMKSIAKSLEEYRSDWKSYPSYTIDIKHSAFNRSRDKEVFTIFKDIPTFANSEGRYLHTLTTPAAYSTDYYSDPFSNIKGVPFAYYANNKGYILYSAGIDFDYDLNINNINDYINSDISQPLAEFLSSYSYDPSNGIGSSGDIILTKDVK